MANTYTQVHLQFVFAPKYRASLINSTWENDLYKYMTGIVQTNKHKLIVINGMPDHVHLLVGFRATQSMADFMQDVKAGSSKWINDNKYCKERFEWQAGYGAFSYSKSQLPTVIRYIENQKEHHRKKPFLEEYKLFLEKFEVDYDERYVFQEPK
ncbi:MAG TPA: IS200/IS605 family transposase [Agriterribacter sp.]|nr:IS200/IS605 family transposase [Chitinophagaceae bacterium]HRP32120.1 IS200/IS605 family transposase [Agriterribacter sp.]